MELTSSYDLHVPDGVRERYSFLEVRNAAAVLKAADPAAFDEVMAVLAGFSLQSTDLTVRGGNRGTVAQKLDGAFEALGWDAVRINTVFSLRGVVKGGRRKGRELIDSRVESAGFEVDNFKRRVAVDVEWNAKDGNLDRDLSAYRALYDAGVIDCAVIVTRDYESILNLTALDLRDDDAHARMKGTTTTNTRALQPKLTRGDAGGCPVLVVAIARSTWDGVLPDR